MTQDEKAFFLLVDAHVRKCHQAILTESFLDPEGHEYHLCFRPLHPPQDPFACCYVSVPVETIRIAASILAVPQPVAESIGYELRIFKHPSQT
jgi:hypothetical protein